MKNVAITGASSGIGKELALCFAKEKARLFLNARKEHRLKALKKELEKLGSEVVICAFDVSDEKACKAWCEELFKQDIHILILNAGIASADDESVQRQIDIAKTNVLGIVNIIFYALEAMQKQKNKIKTQIVLMSSIASFLALPNAPTYSASKHFVSALAQALSLAYPQFCFTLINPGFVKTPLTSHIHNLKMMSAAKASKRIYKAIKARKRILSFPFYTAFFARVFSFLPFILQRLFVNYLQKRAKL